MIADIAATIAASPGFSQDRAIPGTQGSCVAEEPMVYNYIGLSHFGGRHPGHGSHILQSTFPLTTNQKP